MPLAPSLFERALSRISPVRAGEGAVVAVLFANIFTLLFAYYLIKPVREVLVLTEASAEVRSYALAAQAALMMLVIPAYTAVFRRIYPHYQVVPWITGFLTANLLAFVACGKAGMSIGVAYFVWIGIFNVLIVAQFWAFAADLFNVESGERLFVLVAIGASVGAWAGSIASKFLFALLDPYQMMLAAAALLLATVPMSSAARALVPARSRAPPQSQHPDEVRGIAAGFRLVLSDPYLRAITLFVILLNCVKSTGDYLQAGVVRAHAESLVQSGAVANAGVAIGAYYGDYYAWINGLGLAIQLLLVGRIFRAFGVGGAVLVLPAIAALGYGAVAIFPVFALVHAVKVAEDSVNYSLQNTSRNALMLPCDEEQKYAGKTTIDTFFWRLGDFAQAAVVWVGGQLGAGPAQFALVNFALAAVWIALTVALGRMHRAKASVAKPR